MDALREAVFFLRRVYGIAEGTVELRVPGAEPSAV
jgi:hypothetical protein